jgi:hypothetical protein
VAGSAALLGTIVRRVRADLARGDEQAVPRGILRAALWIGLFGAGIGLSVLLNPRLAADTYGLCAVLYSLGLALLVVATGLWNHVGRDQVVVWAAWGGLGLIGLGLAVAVMGGWPLAVLWIVPGVVLVVWQALQQRRAS